MLPSYPSRKRSSGILGLPNAVLANYNTHADLYLVRLDAGTTDEVLTALYCLPGMAPGQDATSSIKLTYIAGSLIHVAYPMTVPTSTGITRPRQPNSELGVDVNRSTSHFVFASFVVSPSTLWCCALEGPSLPISFTRLIPPLDQKRQDLDWTR